MNTIPIATGLLLILLMLWQRSAINRGSLLPRKKAKQGAGVANSPPTKKSWRELARYYKAHLRWTRRILWAGWLLLIPTTFLAPDSFPHAYRDVFSNTPAVAVIILFLFFTGTIRMLFEQCAESPKDIPRVAKEICTSLVFPKRYSKRIEAISAHQLSGSNAPDAPISWFLLSLLLALTPMLPWDDRGARPLTLIANTVIMVGYFCWIYVAIYLNLTKRHHFTELAARVFLGGHSDNRALLQAVVIGPASSGKSTFINGGPTNAPKGTTKVEISLFEDNNCDVCAVDTPGENLGDHLYIVTKFRTDTLILVLNFDDVDQGVVKTSMPKKADEAPRFFKNDTSSKAYMVKILAGLKRDATAFLPRDVFRVENFLLFINDFGTRNPNDIKLISSIKSDPGFQDLAKSIGELFGADGYASRGVIASAAFGAQARDLIAR